MSILVTGGASYIGSYICIDLLATGYPVMVVDNLSNSKQKALHRVSEITGHRLDFVRADVRDRAALDTLFRKRDSDAVTHCAGLKTVGESTQIPLEYYANNIGGTLTLCRAMAEAGVKKIVFSSSATVYGDPAKVPIREDFPTCATDPYGRSKLLIEDDPTRPVSVGRRLERRLAALLQSGGCPPQRSDRGRPQRHPQQPDALHRPGGGGPTAQVTSIRERLCDPGRYRHSGLHPRGGSGR